MITVLYNPDKLVSDLVDGHGEGAANARQIAKDAEKLLGTLCQAHGWALLTADGSHTIRVTADRDDEENEDDVANAADAVVTRAIENG